MSNIPLPEGAEASSLSQAACMACHKRGVLHMSEYYSCGDEAFIAVCRECSSFHLLCPCCGVAYVENENADCNVVLCQFLLAGQC